LKQKGKEAGKRSHQEKRRKADHSPDGEISDASTERKKGKIRRGKKRKRNIIKGRHRAIEKEGKAPSIDSGGGPNPRALRGGPGRKRRNKRKKTSRSKRGRLLLEGGILRK